MNNLRGFASNKAQNPGYAWKERCIRHHSARRYIIMRSSILILISALAFNAHAYDDVFYCTYQSDECTEFDNPVSVNDDKMDELLERVGAMKNNFIGFVDVDGTTLQFYVDAVNDIWVEIPVPAKQGSYGKQIKEAEMQKVIKSLESPYMAYKNHLHLTFREW